MNGLLQRSAGLGLWVGVSFALTGCATDYVARTRQVRTAYSSYDYDRALQNLAREEKDIGDINKLLLLLDKGMVLHAAGRWEESNRVLHEADDLSQKLDVTSVTEEAGAVLANEAVRVYRGEDFEKLMISVLLALNYTQLGKDEDAMVEVRRCNERLEKMIHHEKKPYERLAIARYLGGVLYEDQGDVDNAVIDYLDASKLEGNLGSAAEPILRLAKATERFDAYEELKKKYPKLAHEPIAKAMGQLVVIVEAGTAPEKRSSTERQGDAILAVPVYSGQSSFPVHPEVKVGEQTVKTATVTSLDRVAKTHLSDRIGKLLAKSVLSLGVKAGAAALVGAATKSSELGAATFALLAMTQQADTRSWLSLPAEFQVARLQLSAGKHEVQVAGGGRSTKHEVVIRAGRISVLVVRRY